jgi:ATP-dependent helicase/nuclease subunit A
MTRAPIQLTQAQARAIRPDSSVWVRASAGTGKTQVLSARVLRLLLGGTRPERLLCLTYTKAAAAEMATRIFEELSVWAICPPDQLDARLAPIVGAPTARQRSRARTLFARTLDAPGGLRIQTIHSFCQALLARFPLEAGLAPGFTAIEGPAEAELNRQAFEALVHRATTRQGRRLAVDLVRLAVDLSDQSLRDRLDVVRAKLRHAGPLNSLRAEALEPRLRRALGLPPEGTFADWCEAELARGAIDDRVLERIAAAWREGAKKANERADSLAQWLETSDRPAALDHLFDAFLTAKGEIIKDLTDKGSRAANPAIDQLTAEMAPLVKRLRDTQQLFETMARSAPAARVALQLAQDIEAAKRARGLVTLDDLIQATAALLAEPGAAAWVLYKLDAGIEQILVDEAQDTNPAQWRILDALSDEFYAGEGAAGLTRTMFAVGDLKQSIYRFQGAVPALFPEQEVHYGDKAQRADQPFDSVPLDTSFRSAQVVLDVVDAVLASKGPDAFGMGVAAPKHVAARGGIKGRVTLWPLIEAEGDAAAAADPDVAELISEITEPWKPKAERLLAQTLARQISQWLSAGRMLESRGRPVQPGDILVLVSKRTGIMQPLVAELKARSVPVAGVDRIKLTDQIAAQDVIACLRWMLQPDDDLTLAVLLRAPFLGWSEEALCALAAPRPPGQTLWTALRAATDAPAQAAVAWLRRLQALADLGAPFAVIEAILLQLEGRARLFARLGREAEEALVVLADQALAYERTGTPSLQGFVDAFDKSDVEITRDPEGARNEVRVLTVHGAKGLQAPIVILADANRAQETREPVLLLREKAGTALPVFAGNKDTRVGPVADAYDAEDALAEQEYWRLLYVALTRAEDELFVVGHKTGKKASTNGQGSAKDSWHAVVDRALSGLGAQKVEASLWPTGSALELTGGTAVDHSKADVQDATRMLPVLPDWATRAPPLEPIPPRPLAPSKAASVRASLDLDLAPARAQARARGTLMHRLFQRLPEVAPDARTSVADTLARHHGADLPPDLRAAAVAQVLGVLADPAFAMLFSDAGLAEAPVSALVGESVISGQIDRLLVTEARILAVDFKTNLVVPVRPEDTPPAYLRQMAGYRAALRLIWPDRPVETALLWTAAPIMMPLPDHLLDAIIPFVSGAG